MPTDIYIEALLVNEELADEVWQLSYDGEIDDELAEIAWLLVAVSIQVDQGRLQRPLYTRKRNFSYYRPDGPLLTAISIDRRNTFSKLLCW